MRFAFAAVFAFVAAACGPTLTGDPSFDACVVADTCEQKGKQGPEEFCSRIENGVSFPDCPDEADALGECILKNGKCEEADPDDPVPSPVNKAWVTNGACQAEDDALLACDDAAAG